MEKPSPIFVDEFQDINAAQYRLSHSGANRARAFIIGDPTIHLRPGTDYRYFERFKEDFPGTRQIRLVHYRSTPDHAAAGAPYRGTKWLIPCCWQTGKGTPCASLKRATLLRRDYCRGNRPPGGRIDDRGAPLARPRARSRGGETRSFFDFAVLYRTNYQAAALEQCLKGRYPTWSPGGMIF